MHFGTKWILGHESSSTKRDPSLSEVESQMLKKTITVLVQNLSTASRDSLSKNIKIWWAKIRVAFKINNFDPNQSEMMTYRVIEFIDWSWYFRPTL